MLLFSVAIKHAAGAIKCFANFLEATVMDITECSLLAAINIFAPPTLLSPPSF